MNPGKITAHSLVAGIAIVLGGLGAAIPFLLPALMPVSREPSGRWMLRTGPRRVPHQLHGSAYVISVCFVVGCYLAR